MSNKPCCGCKHPFGYALNTSTIKGFELGIVEIIELAAKAGYMGIEPWIAELDTYLAAGGTLGDLGKRLADRGLRVVGGIAFHHWAVNDEGQRRAGLEQAKREMDMLRQLGGCAIAAPPFGEVADVCLDAFAERYAAMLEVGKSVGVTPLLELWGFAARLSRLGELMYVAYESKHPDACVLLDVYHLYKGGNDFESLPLLNGSRLGLLHMNDYPADPPRETIGDADRVYPGDGVAPLSRVLNLLKEIGYCGVLSLELFNPAYWQGDPAEVLRIGLEKTKAAVEAADLG